MPDLPPINTIREMHTRGHLEGEKCVVEEQRDQLFLIV